MLGGCELVCRRVIVCGWELQKHEAPTHFMTAHMHAQDEHGLPLPMIPGNAATPTSLCAIEVRQCCCSVQGPAGKPTWPGVGFILPCAGSVPNCELRPKPAHHLSPSTLPTLLRPRPAPASPKHAASPCCPPAACLHYVPLYKSYKLPLPHRRRISRGLWSQTRAGSMRHSDRMPRTEWSRSGAGCRPHQVR